MARKMENIRYGVAGGQELLLDVCAPDTGTGLPVVVLIHGGGWCSGNKGLHEWPFLENLVAAGVVCVSIAYRLAPQHRWPACMEDVESAIRFIRDHALDYGGDPDRLTLLGYSAGGHLACHAAVTLRDISFRAVVGLAAPVDMVLDNFRRAGVSQSMQHLFGVAAPDADVINKLWDMSSINYVCPGLPPFLLVQGTEDQSVPYIQAAHMQQRLHDMNVSCDLLPLPGAPHGWGKWDAADPNWKTKLVTWIQRHG